MAFAHAGRVAETTTTTGTGNLTLAGAKTGFRTFSSQLSTNDYCYYVIQHQSAAEWEYGIGQLTASTTLVRVLVLGSSNANAAVSFSAGTKDVFISPDARMHNALSNMMFGDGSDGDVTISSGTTTLTKDMFYRNLTISGTGRLDPAGYRVFVSEILDLTAAPAGAISRTANNGNNASGTAAGTAGLAIPSNTVGGSTSGGAGQAGGTTTGVAGNGGGTANPGNGGASGAGGAGGTGASGAGGGSTAGISVANTLPIRRWTSDLQRGVSLILGGSGGSGGSSGGGDGTAGGGSGGGGGANAVVYVSARIINRGGSTAVGAIRAIGGNGGNGGSPAAGNRGGGGGGSGAGGGWIYLAFQNLIGSTASNALDASGGTGGNGATGTGTGTSGNGGTGGSGGRITLVNLGTNTTSDSTGSAGSGPTGVTGGAGNTLRVSL